MKGWVFGLPLFVLIFAVGCFPKTGAVIMPDKTDYLQHDYFVGLMAPDETSEESDNKSDVPEKKAGPCSIECCASGTVVKDARKRGVQECKGDSINLVQGGYMKFDLAECKLNKVSRGYLKVYITNWSQNEWRWVVLLLKDPTTTDTEEVFEEIQKHRNVSGVITLSNKGWVKIGLSEDAIGLINDALSNEKSDEKWVAYSLGFE